MLVFSSPCTHEGRLLRLTRNDRTFTRGLVFFFLLIALFLVNIENAHGARVTVRWNPNNEPDLAGYVLYSSQGAPGEPYDYVATYPLDSINPAKPSCRILKMQRHVPYYFVVTAYNTNNIESGYSNEIDVTPASSGPTVVGGAIYDNTTWTLSGSPYIVTDNVTVASGASSSGSLATE